MKRSRGRWGCLLLLLVVFLFAAGAAWLWHEARSAPAWYAPPDPRAGPVTELAERIEYNATVQMQKIREADEPWTMRLEQRQINAWLAARLPEWVADESAGWPEEFGVPQVRIDEAGIDLAIEVAVGGRSGVLVSRLAPRIVDGQLRLNLEKAGVGRLGVSGEPAEKLIGAFERIAPGGAVGDETIRRFLDLLAGEEGIPSMLELSDGRRVELIELTLGEEMLEITSRTRPAESDGP
ncbi:MAG: hypothetical protein SYC29_06155 [Planctomycetota bacterium]|nr:hypothetical protein [Planctomycetota bacterium]